MARPIPINKTERLRIKIFQKLKPFFSATIRGYWRVSRVVSLGKLCKLKTVRMTADVNHAIPAV